MKNQFTKTLILILKKIAPIADFVLILLVLPSSFILKIYRRYGAHRLPKTTKLLKQVGVFPIIDHYHEPLFNDKHLKIDLNKKRNLPGIDFNCQKQIKFLNKLNHGEEFINFVKEEKKSNNLNNFNLNNGSFAPGDSDFLYQFIRFTKPNKIIEVGGGSSTLIINRAVDHNNREQKNKTNHVCIEPFEQPWLESLKNVDIVRDKIENATINWEKDLEQNDLLFIDSSHVIRPQGDVVFEFLEVLPKLKKGVIIHVHDIFTPYDYPDHWLRKNIFLWNEQYMLEAILGNSFRYEIIASLNLLKKEYFSELKKVCPHLETFHDPGSIYFKIK